MYGGAVFALIATLTAAGTSATTLGGLFAIAAVGGILGAFATPALQRRLPLKALVVIMGWTAAATFACYAWLHQPLIAGALLGCIFFTTAPANAVLLTAQITCTPAPLQGRVTAAASLIAGMAAPLGPPATGAALDTTTPMLTFLGIAVLTALITTVIHLNRPMDGR